MYNRLLNYLNNNSILSENQYGFRKKHSTSLALIDLYVKISLAIDQKEFAVGVFLDLSEDFDTTIDHKILFDKLAYYGIRGLALDWVKSYFSNRLQFVQFNNYCSNANIRCGVPQGSILGSLFFLIYINDIINVSKILDSILFADDTNIFFSHKNQLLN